MARVSATDVEIGPYCLVGPDVKLKDGVRLVGHVNVTGATTIGEGTVVYRLRLARHAAAIGALSRRVDQLVIGAAVSDPRRRDDEYRHCGGGGITRVGERCLFMVVLHVAHDCDIGDDVTFANNAVLGGHVRSATMSFSAAIRRCISSSASARASMIGGLSGAAASIVPFGFAKGQIATLDGLNVVGLRRRGTSRAELHRLRQAYRALFHGEGVFAERIDKVAAAFADDPLVQKVIAFVRASGKRPLMHPATTGDGRGQRSRWYLTCPARTLRPPSAASRSRSSAVAAVFPARSPRRSSGAAAGRSCFPCAAGRTRKWSSAIPIIGSPSDRRAASFASPAPKGAARRCSSGRCCGRRSPRLRPDWQMLRLMPRIAAVFRGGDDRLLSGIAALFEEGGVRIIGVGEVAPEIIVPAGHARAFDAIGARSCRHRLRP